VDGLQKLPEVAERSYVTLLFFEFYACMKVSCYSSQENACHEELFMTQNFVFCNSENNGKISTGE
jgi:hypothetical protein